MNNRLGLTLLLAISAHALLILGVSFTFAPPTSPARSSQRLDITVVHHPRQPEAVEKPDFLAQISQQGGGEKVDKARPRITAQAPPPPPLKQLTPPAPIPVESPKPVSRPVPRVIARKASPKKTPTQVKRPRSKPAAPKNRPSVSQILASSSEEIARITAELDRKTEAYAKRPRRRHISASTQEYKYAAYLEAWRKKVERIGNLNYPDEAKRRKLYGNLVLHVAIRADGSVERINIRKSSGYKILDDAAIRIVRLAAPFAPFSKEIREETDILDITRTWQFLSNNRLNWK